MKKITSFILLLSLTLSLNYCKKDNNDDNNNTNNNPTAKVPVLKTNAITDIKAKKAEGSGEITDKGSFDIIVAGLCWSLNQNPTISDNKTADSSGTMVFNSTIKGLKPVTTYYVRAYATNKAGTAYGDAVSFTTVEGLTDIDNNIYEIIKIGDQTWMQENLRTTHYQNNDAIQFLANKDKWIESDSGAYCLYANSVANEQTYGKLYNWYAVNDNRKLCPAGWHVPSDQEWQTLIDFLGGKDEAGAKMKAIDALWKAPNKGASNSSGFSGLPAGCRLGFDGSYYFLNSYTFYWTATAADAQTAWYRSLMYDEAASGKLSYDFKYGFSVRCIKD
ncbi:MAG: fibrobacter succinogenes major paralogous domain-containing protein [Bacteroidales bacterium]|nr:fibrobacter succinogenes major paralogous domain-containing protein [Bacteroidales bacterium]